MINFTITRHSASVTSIYDETSVFNFLSFLCQTARYKCTKDTCGHEWKMRHSAGGLKSCDSIMCDNEDIQPYDFEPDPWKHVAIRSILITKN